MTEQTTPETPTPDTDLAVEEHRLALRKMRADMALSQLFSGCGARDAAVVARLIDVEEGDVVFDADGVPDVSAVKRKIRALKEASGYLFQPVQDSQQSGVPVSGIRTGVPHAPSGETDDASLTDAEYYRRKLRR